MNGNNSDAFLRSVARLFCVRLKREKRETIFINLFMIIFR